MNKPYFEVKILLGSNLGDRQDFLDKAKESINKLIGEVIFETPIIETEPVDFTADLKFLNQILVIKTIKSPIKCLELVKSIEKSLGRVYTKPKENEKYSSRCIDIDLLNFSDIKYKSDRLELPHSQNIKRIFVCELLKKVPTYVKT